MELIEADELKRNINRQLRRIQSNSDNKLYKNKKKDDRITCVVCNGQYTRSQRSRHLTRKKHKQALKSIYENYNLA